MKAVELETAREREAVLESPAPREREPARVPAPSGRRHIREVLRQRLRGLPRNLRELNYSLQMLSVMRSLGWHQSLAHHRPQDNGAEPRPWYTYPALEWLAPRVKRSHRVFEYGGGYSTVWYGRHAGQVVTVEHDRDWVEQVRLLVGDNVVLLHRNAAEDEPSAESDSAYSAVIKQYAPKTFDIVVIDGRERVRCAHAAPSRLRDDGIIIFDNSDRPEYRSAIDYLHGLGLGRIDFYGFIANVGTRSCTSVFSRFNTRWTSGNNSLVWQGW